MTATWVLAAACRGKDPDLWFSDDPRVADLAIRICETCPVRWDCYDDALATDDSTAYGIRAGLTGRQRTAARRRQQQIEAAA